MKLVELLAKELKEWPEEATMAVQDADGQIKMAAGENPQNRNGQDRVWVRDDEVDHKIQHRLRDLATDHATAIVTRADWEAEKARIAGKVDGGWKRHKGVKQPVADGVKVEIRTRGGDFEVCSADGFAWGATGNSQIMAYRIHNPAEQPAPVSEEAIQVGIDAADAGKLTPIAEVKARIPSLKTERALKDALEGNTAKFSSIDELMQDLGESMPQPIAWRNRIYELDTQRAELEATYQRQIGEIDGERVELVRRLASEGLALVEVVQPVEDMSDWRNWKVGDLLSYAKDSFGFYVNGDRYAIQSIKGERLVIDDKTGNKDHAWNAVVVQSYFKWHSRPGK